MSKLSRITESDNWFQGEVKDLRFDIVDSGEVPIDVSSYTLRWVLEEEHDADGDLILKTSAIGSEITVGDGAATNDRVTVSILGADTANLEPRVYRQSLWRVDVGAPQLLAQGSAMLQRAASEGGGS